MSFFYFTFFLLGGLILVSVFGGRRRRRRSIKFISSTSSIKKIINKSNRYLTKNTFVLCVETLTVLLWGPGCFLVAALILQRSPWRYPLQIIVSMGQLYGDTLYYATSFFDHAVNGISYSRPEAVYFWFYFVGCNAVSFFFSFFFFSRKKKRRFERRRGRGKKKKGKKRRMECE